MAKTTKKLIALLLAVVMITTLISPSNYSWSNAAETRGGDAYATATDSIAMLSSAAVTGNLEDYITGATIADKAGNISVSYTHLLRRAGSSIMTRLRLC